MERRNTTKSPQEVLVLCRERDVKAVSLRFSDFLGATHQLTVPISQLTDAAFEDGFGFDGSSVDRWPATDEANLLLLPLPESARIDPFNYPVTIVLNCAILDPLTREEVPHDPRNISRRAENYLQHSGVADEVLIGLQTSFFLFDEVQFGQAAESGFYRIGSQQKVGGRLGEATDGLDVGDLESTDLAARDGFAPRRGLGRAEVPSALQGAIMQTLLECGVEVDWQQRETNWGSQVQINLRPETLMAICDSLSNTKAIVKHVARQYGKIASFMPKPIVGQRGNSLHIHLSLWKANEPLFAGTGYAGLSDQGLNAIGGILKHAPALLALTNPTTNSYRRLVAGPESPTVLAYSQRNRTAACRIPMTSPSPKSKRIEFRCPDPTTNPYLSFSAILMAVTDGIQNKIPSGGPLEQDALRESLDPAHHFAQTPSSLSDALSALEEDSDFLIRGDVFSEGVLRNWIEDKRRNEIDPLNLRPHPFEFCMYFDA